MNRLVVLALIVSFLVMPVASVSAQSKPVKTPAKLVSPKPLEALPWWGDPAYQIIHESKPMDVLQILAFGLRPAVLAEEWVALNWYSKESRFKLETLPVGTIVLVDQFGHVQYKYDCSNRLVPPTGWIIDWPETAMVLPTTGPTTNLPTTTPRRANNWIGRILNRINRVFE